MKKIQLTILGVLFLMLSVNAQNEMETIQTGKKQFSKTIVINASIEKVWDVIKDSNQMETWGPPVQKVELITKDTIGQEKIGSIRKVDVIFGKKEGYFMEKRINQEELKRLDYQIFEENIGLFKVLKNVGFSMEIESDSPNNTILTFTFYQNPKGFFGWLMHPMVKMNQKKGNKEGMESLKKYIEKL